MRRFAECDAVLSAPTEGINDYLARLNANEEHPELLLAVDAIKVFEGERQGTGKYYDENGPGNARYLGDFTGWAMKPVLEAVYKPDFSSSVVLGYDGRRFKSIWLLGGTLSLKGEVEIGDANDELLEALNDPEGLDVSTIKMYKPRRARRFASEPVLMAYEENRVQKELFNPDIARYPRLALSGFRSPGDV
ncbi:MAG: hypothetical protein JWN82_220 [Candidatus Saccharibacteria bacterium]|nr:hypothetical protein [Candidatus Saccharibacteria bacterium]